MMRFSIVVIFMVLMTGCGRPHDPRATQEFFNAVTQTDVSITNLGASPASMLTPGVDTTFTVNYDYEYRLYPIWEKFSVYETPMSATPLFEYEDICVTCMQTGSRSYSRDCKLDQFQINGVMRLGFGCYDAGTLAWDTTAINTLPTTLYVIAQVKTLNTIAQDIVSDRTLAITLDNP